MSVELELRRGDEVSQRWPAVELLKVLSVFWGAVLEEGVLHDRWYRTRLFVPGHGDVAAAQEQRDELAVLGVRRFEPEFVQTLVALHAEAIQAGASFSQVVARLIAIPPNPPERVVRVIDVLRRALSVSEPLVHLGSREETLPVPAQTSFTLLEQHGVYPNGAGTITHASEWQLDLCAPIRLRVVIEESSEEGYEVSSGVVISSVVPIQPLLDAFVDQGIYVRNRVVEPLE